MLFAKLRKLMFPSGACMRYARAVLPLMLFTASFTSADDSFVPPTPFHPMRLDYRVEWRLVTAGDAQLDFKHGSGSNVDVSVKLESSGLLTHLFRIQDAYHALMNKEFCLSSAHLDAEEGKRHMITDINLDSGRRKSTYDEHDVIKNTAKHIDLDVASCTYDITGSIQAMREIDLSPGKATFLPITDGKKFAKVRILAGGKDTITVNDKKYQTVRYEAFMFDNVLYKRKGSLEVWLTDDAARLPVLMRFQFGFPVGTVSIELVKQQDL